MPVKRSTAKRRSSGRTSLTTSSTSRVGKKAKFALTIPELCNTEKGHLLTLGQGDVGQLGLGSDIMERNRPALVPNVEDVVEICAGGMHTICINSNGEVITFGCNDEGALGRDTSKEGSESEPGKVTLESHVVQITAGDSHSAALLDNGQVFAWGSFRDSHGNMGLTLQGNAKLPVEILPGVIVVKIASGADHLVMLSEDGHLYTCGCGEQGQLGRVTERGAGRDSRQGLSQLLVPGLINFNPRLKLEFENIWTGTYSTFAKEKSEGKIYAFGLNNYNQLGLADQRCQFRPVVCTAFAGKNWIKICGGQHHTVALDSEGLIHVLGRKEYGRLGLGENSDDADVPTSVPLLAGKKGVDVGCGSAVSFAVLDTGEVFGWGMGTNGQLGTGDESDVYEPVEIRGKQLESRKVLQVAAGGQHTVLLASALNN